MYKQIYSIIAPHPPPSLFSASSSNSSMPLAHSIYLHTSKSQPGIPSPLPSSSQLYPSPLSHPFPLPIPSQSPNTSQLRLLRHTPNPQPLTILLQHPLIMVFPELLARVLPRNPLQYLASARMLVDKPCVPPSAVILASSLWVSAALRFGGWSEGARARRGLGVGGLRL